MTEKTDLECVVAAALKRECAEIYGTVPDEFCLRLARASITAAQQMSAPVVSREAASGDTQSPLSIAYDRQEVGPLGAIVRAMSEYHLALDQRRHGGVAATEAIKRIEEAIGRPWRHGEELRRRVNGV